MASVLTQSNHIIGMDDSNGKPGDHVAPVERFRDVPSSIDIPVNGQEDEAVEIDLEELLDDPTELCTLLENENAARTYWMTVAMAYAKQNKLDHAIEMLIRANQVLQTSPPRERISLLCGLCWLYLQKSRHAPRVNLDANDPDGPKIKDHYLQLATSSLNDASRINAHFPPLFLARGVLLLLKASLQPPSKQKVGALDPERVDLLQQALRSFEDALRVSHHKNMLAIMGKARALFSLGKYVESLAAYQQVLSKTPHILDPDPRIGIGCCLWQLGHKEQAKQAWERSLELNPKNKFAMILLGVLYLDSSTSVAVNSEAFSELYKKALTEYTQSSFKLDKNLPLTCVTFASYFLSRKAFDKADSLAHKAIQYTDVNAIASEGWYILARKEHYAKNYSLASDYYRRSDDARGGAENGYLPAKFGSVQLSIIRNDISDAKLRLEKIVQQYKSYEALVLLGTLEAQDAFRPVSASFSKEDKGVAVKKAASLLEAARAQWKDEKKHLSPDAPLLLNLARLYETDHPDKSLQCLLQVEDLEIGQVSDSDRPSDVTDEAELKTELRKKLAPQLLNNIGCLYTQSANYAQAAVYLQAARSACSRLNQQQVGSSIDVDALSTTISFNLARNYEWQGLVSQAMELYQNIISRHPDYTDARTRLVYLLLRKSPQEEGPKAMSELYQEFGADLEVRALYGWFLGKVMRTKAANVMEDVEFRHHKHTLQNYDKHDRYALVAMGNMLLSQAREMRRESSSDKAKRSSAYTKALEFFDKALLLDSQNAYAATGIAIAVAEDRKDLAAALPILLRVRDSVKDAPHVHVNLGHIYTELRQFTKAIESYTAALQFEGKGNDSLILSCLGRAWLLKGRLERNTDALYSALDCARKARASGSGQPHLDFNVAFIQTQLADAVYKLPEKLRSATQIEEALRDLEDAAVSLDTVAKNPQPPYPKQNIELRANMVRNTQWKQLERALVSQRDYEVKNKEKLQAALAQRNEEIRLRDEKRQKALDLEKQRQERIRKEREEIAARDRQQVEERLERERALAEAELTTDDETGEKVKRKRKPASNRSRQRGSGGEDEGEGDEEGKPRRRKPRQRSNKSSSKAKKRRSSEKDEDDDGIVQDGHSSGSNSDDLDESDDEESAKPKRGGARQPAAKKRRLAVRKEPEGKYKSAEFIVDSSDDDSDQAAPGKDGESRSPRDGGDSMVLDDEGNGANSEDDEDREEDFRKRSRRGRVIDDDSDEE